MTNAETRPCARALDADCYKAHPAWARRAFAYRLIHLLAPAEITRRLPKLLRLALIAPDVVIPPGVDIPDGTVINPGTDVPPDWTAPDPTPPGIIIPPGTEFPSDWTPEDGPPPGVPAFPWAKFPPGWSPGTGPIDGILQPPETPGPAQDTGVTPPTYIAPGEPGPITITKPTPPPEKVITAYGTTSDGTIRNQETSWAAAQGGADGDLIYTTGYSASTGITALQLSYGFIVWRSFLYFNVPSIPAGNTVTSVTLFIQGRANFSARVCVHEGTQEDPLTLADFPAFASPFLAMTNWTTAYNRLDFNQAGVDYINSVTGKLAKFALREYDHDYLDVEPPLDVDCSSGLYFQEAQDSAHRPLLSFTYK